MSPPLAPVAVFAYNRPWHLRQMLDALAACAGSGHTQLHVFADGPRTPAAASAVGAVRDVLEQEAKAGRFAGFRIHASDANKGLAASIIGGVGEVLAVHDRVIVVEDDLLVTRDFLQFMNDCLAYYADDGSVGAVTGFCPLRQVPRGYGADVFLASRTSSQGWGTWARVWEGVDWSGAGQRALDTNWSMRRKFNLEGNDRYDRLRRQSAGRIDSWSIRFGLSLHLRGLATVYPVVNRIANIGYDGSGVHSGTGVPLNTSARESAYALQRLRIDPRIQRAMRRAYSGPLPKRWLREVLCRWPRLATWLGR